MATISTSLVGPVSPTMINSTTKMFIHSVTNISSGLNIHVGPRTQQQMMLENLFQNIQNLVAHTHVSFIVTPCT